MFYDRTDAGKKLATALEKYRGDDIVVIALPRGGVVVGAEVASSLDAPLDVVLVRKIVDTDYPEYALGAITDNGDAIYDRRILPEIDNTWLKEAESDALRTLTYRKKLYYGTDKTKHTVTNKTVIVVDDGIATGLSMKAAINAVEHANPDYIVVAAPVSSQRGFAEIQPLVDELIILEDPKEFMGFVGAHYSHFDQVTDEEVYTVLREVEYAIHRKVA